jgi:hypothetical protein
VLKASLTKSKIDHLRTAVVVRKKHNKIMENLTHFLKQHCNCKTEKLEKVRQILWKFRILHEIFNEFYQFFHEISIESSIFYEKYGISPTFCKK